MMASCLPHEIPVELSMSTYSFSNDKNTKIVEFCGNFRTKKICEAQHPSKINFTFVRCGKDISSPCTMVSGLNWNKWSLNQRKFLIRTNKNNRIKLDYVIFIDDDKTICDLAIDRTAESSDEFEGYGQVLISGWADELLMLGNLVNLFDSDEYSIPLQL